MENDRSSTNRYQAYKDSGIEWLGDVPEHWEERRVKDIATLERGKFTHRPRNDPQMYDGVHPFIQTGDVARAIKYIIAYKQTLSDKGTTVSKKFKKGTLVMAIAANIGDVAVIDFDTYFPDSIVAYKPKNNNTDYLFYLFSATRHELDKVKVISTQDNLSLERLNSLIRFIPPISEQKLIATYLDTKTAQIDRKIDLLTQKATQYGNLKQSLINETVTRGLDKSVPMKDSGVEAIGEIPKHWQVKRLKDLLISGNLGIRIGLFGSSLKSEIMKNQGYKIYGQEHVINDNFIMGNKYIDEFKFKELQSYEILPNDLLVTMMGTVGKSKIVPEHIERGIMDSHLIRIRIDKSVFIPNLLALSINESIYIHDQRKILTKGSIMEGLNSRIIKALNIAVPPLSEQKAIADYLDTKTAQIDQIIQTINTQIDKLKEVRKTLINDVVTGKIKVV